MSKNFKIPWVIARDRIEDEDYNAAYAAAHKHKKQAQMAEDDITVAYDLAKTLRDSLEASRCDVGFTAMTVVNEITKHLDKAHSHLDRHRTRHNNLFIAYCDLITAGGVK